MDPATIKLQSTSSAGFTGVSCRNNTSVFFKVETLNSFLFVQKVKLTNFFRRSTDLMNLSVSRKYSFTLKDYLKVSSKN